jgi:hypothetical protein
MAKYSQGIFTPKNPKKYCGPNLGKIEYRSSWEHTVMMWFDKHPYILRWSSECIPIQYQHPFLRTKAGRPMMKTYLPDFFVVYMDRNQKQHAEIWEVKPLKENPWINQGGKFDTRTQGIRAVNYAKWIGALKYCAKNRLQFKVLTEQDIFAVTRQ